MQVTPIAPVARATNDKRPAYAKSEPQAKRTAHAVTVDSANAHASANPGLYGKPGPFGAFPCYGNFSAKV